MQHDLLHPLQHTLHRCTRRCVLFLPQVETKATALVALLVVDLLFFEVTVALACVAYPGGHRLAVFSDIVLPLVFPFRVLAGGGCFLFCFFTLSGIPSA